MNFWIMITGAIIFAAFFLFPLEVGPIDGTLLIIVGGILFLYGLFTRKRL